jgi:hypothetical protein
MNLLNLINHYQHMWVTVSLKANHGLIRLKNLSRDFHPTIIIFYLHLVL